MAPRRTLAFVLCFCMWCTIVPPCILFGSVAFLYRFLVTQLLRRIFRPDLGPPLTVIDFGFSFDDFYGKQLGAQSKVMRLDGTLDPKSIENILSDLLGSGTQEHGRKVENADYRRLTQLYPSFWFGYPFWTYTKQEFRIQQHLKILTNVENVSSVIEKWHTSPFTLGYPLWDVLVISGYKDQDGNLKSIFGIRVHHAVADGLSVIYFGQKEFLKNNEVFVNQHNPLTPRSTTPGVIIQSFLNKFWIPWVMCHMVWRILLSSDALSNRIRGDEFDCSEVTLRLEDLKALRAGAVSKFPGSRVSFTNVFLMCLSGAIRSFYQNEMEGNFKSDLRKGIRVTVPTTKRNPHPIFINPPSISNHWGLIFLDLPILEPNPFKRLHNLIEQESWAKFLNASESNWLLFHLSSTIPKWIFSKLIQYPRGVTCGVSIMPPINHQVDLCWHAVTKIFAMPGLQAKQANLNFAVLTYKDDVVVTLTGRSGLFSKTSGSRLLQKYLVDEVKNLLDSESQEV